MAFNRDAERKITPEEAKAAVAKANATQTKTSSKLKKAQKNNDPEKIAKYQAELKIAIAETAIALAASKVTSEEEKGSDKAKAIAIAELEVAKVKLKVTKAKLKSEAFSADENSKEIKKEKDSEEKTTIGELERIEKEYVNAKSAAANAELELAQAKLSNKIEPDSSDAFHAQEKYNTAQETLKTAARARLESGYKIFRETFAEKEGVNKAHPAETYSLATAVSAFRNSQVSINGVPPDSNYPIEAYFSSGGRVIYDVTDLSSSDQDLFWKLLFEKQEYQDRAPVIYPRPSSHRFGNVTATGGPAEIAVPGRKKPISAAYNFLTQMFPFGSTCLGMNVPLGKDGQTNGNYGHMCICRDSRGLFGSTGDAVMLGIENVSPGWFRFGFEEKENVYSKGKHFASGVKSKKSCTGLPKLGSEELYELHVDAGYPPMVPIGAEYNGITAIVTPTTLLEMKKIAERELSKDPFAEFRNNILGADEKTEKGKWPEGIAIKVKEPKERIKVQGKYRDMSKETSNYLPWMLGGAILVTLIGVGLCCIPGLQPVGATLAYFGIKATVATTMACGLILFAAGTAVGAEAGEGIKNYIVRKKVKKEPFDPKPYLNIEGHVSESKTAQVETKNVSTRYVVEQGITTSPELPTQQPLPTPQTIKSTTPALTPALTPPLTPSKK